eukprot:GHVS01080561.1.p1 GENE.GHVS01080561.1~~GHVS01080561.1.p1  ORF type:complete len:270 (+),score=92.21 GHVS01080561.1:118-927(+)
MLGFSSFIPLFAVPFLLLYFPFLPSAVVSIPSSSPLTLHSRLLNASPPPHQNTDKTKEGGGDWLEIGRYSLTRDNLASGGFLLLQMAETTGAEGRGGDATTTATTSSWKDHREMLLQHMRSVPSSSSASLSFKLSSSSSLAWHIQTSLPLAHLSPTSSSHGVLSLHLTADGSPFALSYERREQPSTADHHHYQLLTDDDFVLQLPTNAPEVLVMPKQPAPSPDGPKPPPTPLSLIQRYWWVLVVVLLVTAMMGTEPAQAAGGQQQSRGR